MKITTHVACFILALVFFVFGLNAFLQFIPHSGFNDIAVHYIGLTTTGYYWLLLRSLEAIWGLALLVGLDRTLSLGILALQVFVFYILMEPMNLSIAPIMIRRHCFLKYRWRYYQPVFTKNIVAGASESEITSTPCSA